MTGQLKDIHKQFLVKITGHSTLKKIVLKYPLPERPVRALGIIKIEGQVYEAEKFMRVMVLTTDFAVSSRCSRSIFLNPRVNLFLPVFSSETILMGAKRAFLVDIHPTVRHERWAALDVEQRLLDIRERYRELFAEPLTLPGKINDIMSAAHCYVKVPPELDGMALSLFNEYLDVFLALVDSAAPVAAEQQGMADEDFETYYQTVINHDPAVRLYSLLFGKTGALERVNDMFFAR
jgi:hypothetical protein